MSLTLGVAVALALGCVPQTSLVPSRVSTPEPVPINQGETACNVKHGDGQSEQAGFSILASIDVAPDGSVYASDLMKVRRIAPDGTVTSLDPKTESITGLTVDSDGTLYLIDYFQKRILKGTSAGDWTVLAGSNYQDTIEDPQGWRDGKGAEARFASPWGLCIDADGNVIVADTFNHRIRKVQPDGTVTTIAGSGRTGGSSEAGGHEDGPALEAKFWLPREVVQTSDGAFYIIDGEGKRIRKLSPEGQVTTIYDVNNKDFFDRVSGLEVAPDGQVLFVRQGRLLRLSSDGEASELYAHPQVQYGKLERVAYGPDKTLYLAERHRVFRMAGFEGPASLLAGHLPICVTY